MREREEVLREFGLVDTEHGVDNRSGNQPAQVMKLMADRIRELEALAAVPRVRVLDEVKDLLESLDDAVNARESSCHPLAAEYERRKAWDLYRMARASIEDALAAPSAAAGREVTEAMVEAAQSEYRKQWEWEFNSIEDGPISADARKRVMKAAITAALAAERGRDRDAAHV